MRGGVALKKGPRGHPHFFRLSTPSRQLSLLSAAIFEGAGCTRLEGSQVKASSGRTAFKGALPHSAGLKGRLVSIAAGHPWDAAIGGQARIAAGSGRPDGGIDEMSMGCEPRWPRIILAYIRRREA